MERLCGLTEINSMNLYSVENFYLIFIIIYYSSNKQIMPYLRENPTVLSGPRVATINGTWHFHVLPKYHCVHHITATYISYYHLVPLDETHKY